MKVASSRRLAIAVSAIVLLSVSTYVLGWSSLFNVDQVKISGSPTKESEVEISQVVAISPGLKMARVDPRSIENRLLEFPWIKSVEITRGWVSGLVELKIEARTPIALYNPTSSKSEWIDQSGEIFTLPGGFAKDLPRVQANSVDAGLAAIKLFTTLPQDFRVNLSLITATSSNNFVIALQHNGREIRTLWGDQTNSDLKVRVINELLLLPENKSIVMIDVSAPHAPIVK